MALATSFSDKEEARVEFSGTGGIYVCLGEEGDVLTSELLWSSHLGLQ